MILISKTVISIILSTVVAFLIIAFFLFFSQYEIHDGMPILKGDETYVLKKEFYLKHPPKDEKRIFLIGSSQMIALNTTFIDNYILSHNKQNYRVYNLASNGDQPKERLKTLDLIIDAKPIVVAYGIAPRDFQDSTITSVSSKPVSPLIDPEQTFHKLLKIVSENFKIDLDFMESPKFITLQSLKTLTKEKNTESEEFPYPDTYVKIRKKDTIIKTESDLLNHLPITTPITKINVVENDNLIAMKQIIQKFHQNNIHVIILVVPESRAYLDIMPDSYKNSFNLIVKELSELQGTKIYRLDEAYADLHIWADPIHVAISNATTIYSQDVAKNILSEVS